MCGGLPAARSLTFLGLLTNLLAHEMKALNKKFFSDSFVFRRNEYLFTIFKVFDK